jgi:ribosomal protein S18 acetylase RimI-like enzyme
MNNLTSIDDIVAGVAKIRNLRKGFVTNFFLDYSKHQIWIDHNALYSECIGDTFFLIKRNDDFWNVFYASTSQDELINAAVDLERSYPAVIKIVDVVGRKKDCELMQQSLDSIFSHEYCRLVRMSKSTSMTDCRPSDKICRATEEQAKEVHSLLNTYFDKRTEQIPYVEELQAIAENNQILLYIDNGRIAGFVVYEMSKMSLYLRYWFVHPNFRERGIGSELLKQFFYDGRDTKRQQLWVICSNENAIKRYVHYGFNEENLFDFVITNKNIKYERENS